MAGVRFDERTETRLSNLSSVTHRPKSYFLKEAMTAYLDAYEKPMLVIARYEEQVRLGTLKTISMDAIMKELNFDPEGRPSGDKFDLVDKVSDSKEKWHNKEHLLKGGILTGRSTKNEKEKQQ